MKRRAGAAPLLFALAAALAVRAVYFLQIRKMPALLEPVLDGAAHLEWARGWLAGTWPPPEAFFRAPGVVYWVGGALSVFGEDPSRVAAAQIFLGAGTAGLTAALAGRLFGRAAAWMAGAGAALYPMFPFFDGQLLDPFLAVPLALAASLVSLDATERGGWPRLIGASVLWSVAGIVRPPLLLAALLFPHALFWRKDTPYRRADAFVALALVLLLPAAATVRNAAVGDPVFLASQGGLNLYLGNHARANGYAATFPDDPSALGYRMVERAKELAEADRGVPLNSAAVSRYWVDRTLEDVAADPAGALRRLVRKALLFWESREIPNNHDPVLFREFLPVMRWLPGWSFWAPLGLLGLWSARRDPAARQAGGVVAAVFLGCVLFFVNARFRIPAAPFLIALGAGGILELARVARGGDFRKALAPVGVLAGAALFVAWNPYGIPRTASPLSYVLLAEAEAGRGERVRALRWIEQALEREPGLYAARIAQIDLLRRTGRTAEALRLADGAVQALPGDPRLRNELGILLDIDGRPAEALNQFQMALRLSPGYEPAMINRAVALARTGRTAEAEEFLRAFLASRPRSAEARRAQEVLTGISRGEIGP